MAGRAAGRCHSSLLSYALVTIRDVTSCKQIGDLPPWQACMMNILGLLMRCGQALPSNIANRESKARGFPSWPKIFPRLPWLNIVKMKASEFLCISRDRSLFACFMISCKKNLEVVWYIKGTMRTVHASLCFTVVHCWFTHWGQDKMADISQTTFSNVFSWKKMYEFRLIFHWNLFPMFQLTIFQHWFR